MSDHQRLFRVLDALLTWPKWLQRAMGVLLGVGITEGAWSGGVWGIAAISACGVLILVVIAVGDAAIKEAEDAS